MLAAAQWLVVTASQGAASLPRSSLPLHGCAVYELCLLPEDEGKQPTCAGEAEYVACSRGELGGTGEGGGTRGLHHFLS